MRSHRPLLPYGLLLVLMLPIGCSNRTVKITNPAEPLFSAQLFSALSAQVTNPYFPLPPGTAFTYTEETDEGVETIIVEVLETTRLVAGVLCVIVRDRVYLDGLLLEDTYDWYAQDRDGNVWYMGEEVVNYEYDDDGNVIGTDSEGSWETGLDVAGVGATARAGILMKATFVVGDSYGQEFYPGEAEDMGEIVALDVLVTLADGSTFRCLQTRDWNPLEAGSSEFKYYAMGLGFVAGEKEDGSDRAEYKGRFDVTDASLPDFAGASFSAPTQIDNPFLPWVPRNVRAFVDEADEEAEAVIVEVLPTTRVVLGVLCVQVRDRVYVDELLIEDTIDWYCQDDAGNVWYMGEEVVNYEYDEDGNLLGTDSGGSWEAGIDGAEAGIAMWANPILGRSYQQEYYEDEAEDMAVVVGTDLVVDLPCGVRFTGCRKILEWTPLEPDSLEYKYYAPGQGVIMEAPLDGSEPVQFLGHFFTGPASLPDIGAATFSNPSVLTNPWLSLTPGSVSRLRDRYGGLGSRRF
ncbi:MAG: hypothetical protein HC813_00340, partial [Planctomycetes bacterium]|nr:hypothetical protein [Planctomycetota bacterium]